MNGQNRGVQLRGFIVMAYTPMQLLVQHAQAKPQPPSARTELPIPKELDAVVLACLAKDPSDRPQTARELARRLEAVPGSDEWTQELARSWWESHQPVRS
jgi:serine/threonine-protein kinase